MTDCPDRPRPARDGSGWVVGDPGRRPRPPAAPWWLLYAVAVVTVLLLAAAALLFAPPAGGDYQPHDPASVRTERVCRCGLREPI